MSNLDALNKRIDKMLAQEHRRLSFSSEEQPIVVRLPVKDNEPAIPYRHGPIYFYVPEYRQQEGTINEQS